jgi:hypothetical protein
MRRNIHYGIDQDTGLVVSQVYHEGYAIPVLDFEGMKPENGYKAVYNLTKFKELTGILRATWTRKIPTEIKNRHRVFWGMKPL